MADLAARCPHCATIFRITDSQLEVADGLVRCGACLSVFHAEDNRVELAPPGGEPAHGQQSLFDTETDEQGIDETPGAAESADSDREDTPWTLHEDDFDEDAFDEEVLLRDIARTNATLLHDNHPGSRPAGDDDQALDRDAASERTDAAPESADPHPEPEITDPAPETTDPEPAFDDPEREAAGPAPALDAPDPGGPEPEVAAEPAAAPWREDLDSLGLNALDLDDEPRGPPRPSARRHPVRWFLLSLLAALGLLGQYLYYNFDELTQSPYRPWLEQLCQYGPCSLPDAARLDLIEARQLQVSSHPQREQALRVDIILSNRASFPQPFPSLELSFANLQGEPVAARRFQPREYLGATFREEAIMPPRQPVQVRLDIADPGESAVSFQVQLHSARR